jgi:hypothetical protein
MILSGLAWLGCAVALQAEDSNPLTEAEKAAGFESLFDGRDLDGWQHNGNWVVEDGAIAWKERGGNLVYAVKKIPDDFELQFQWKVGPGSNSGVYYRPTQVEYQILDNAAHADGGNPRTSAASLYFCMAPSRDATRPVGEWNTGRVVCQGTVIQHWLNGEKVIDLDYADPRWSEEVELLRQRGGDLTARGANLLLQDHGDPVWFRGIKLRELGPDDQLDRTPVTPQEIPEQVRQAERERLERILQRKAKPQPKKQPKKTSLLP